MYISTIITIFYTIYIYSPIQSIFKAKFVIDTLNGKIYIFTLFCALKFTEKVYLTCRNVMPKCPCLLTALNQKLYFNVHWTVDINILR